MQFFTNQFSDKNKNKTGMSKFPSISSLPNASSSHRDFLSFIRRSSLRSIPIAIEISLVIRDLLSTDLILTHFFKWKTLISDYLLVCTFLAFAFRNQLNCAHFSVCSRSSLTFEFCLRSVLFERYSNQLNDISGAETSQRKEKVHCCPSLFFSSSSPPILSAHFCFVRLFSLFKTLFTDVDAFPSLRILSPLLF